ncbi:MAG: hypothetical protein OXI24_02825 [Candidatus Poribacteria bacterium]|nr:hypothetical protein [Candidatus Poribacteria bacterium]
MPSNRYLPVPNADNIRKAAVEKYGPPDGQETYEDGLREMIGTMPDTVIFSNLHPTVRKITETEYDYSDGGGLLKGLVQKHRSEVAKQAGDIVYYTGVHTC